jgi:hypothetical protein
MINLLECLTKMKINESNTLIVVDVQPGHESYITFDINLFCEYLNDHKGNIHYLFNGEDLGYESVDELRDWLVEHGVDEDVVYSIDFIEKSYGWLRDMIDSGVSEDDIKKVLSYMINNDIDTSEDIEEVVYSELNLDDIEDFTGVNTIYQPSIINSLKRLPSSGTIVGGGKQECLLEVELTLEALNKHYTRDNKFVY